MTKSIKSIINFSGVSASIVDVECHITNGLPAIVIIGYASKAVDEAKERLRASFANCQIPLPKKRITINLSPADIPKDSTSLDLAMAVSILSESGQILSDKLGKCLFLGELSLDGSLKPVHGLIGRILSARDHTDNEAIFYIPKVNLRQALLIPGINIKSVNSLKDIYLDLSGTLSIGVINTGKGKLEEDSGNAPECIDLSEISGQPIAKRALEISAAGHHNILLHGPPGTGKSMLAKAMCGILPKLDHSEVLEVTHIHSLVSGGLDKIITSRPFRSPHHTASTIAIVGGGTTPKPGETSLAHRGVLFLDELPEFSRGSLEALRQPLEDGFVSVARAKDSATYPANFILVATQNPCPCGFWGTKKICQCSASAISRYQKRVSGPILDRIDLHLPVNEVDHKRILEARKGPSESDAVAERVTRVYKVQKTRFGKTRFNSSMSNKEVRELAKLSAAAKELLDTAAAKLDISARSYVRTVKVARTIADLAGNETIEPQHISEALQYRQQTLVD
jgi:magnesium chelatase family protein